MCCTIGLEHEFRHEDRSEVNCMGDDMIASTTCVLMRVNSPRTNKLTSFTIIFRISQLEFFIDLPPSASPMSSDHMIGKRFSNSQAYETFLLHDKTGSLHLPIL